MKIKSNTSLSLRKVLLSALVAAPLATLPAPLWAVPVNPHGTPGSTNVTSNSSATTFFQAGTTLLQITDTAANRLVLKWNEFGSGGSPINAGDTLIWTLPSAASAVLNMVTTGATLVNGTLQSNGSIFIVNSNGITLSNTSVVNAAGLGLSTTAQNEFFFLANGTLDTSGIASATGDVTIGAVGTLGTGTSVSARAASEVAGINVGSTGNIVLAGRSVSVSGIINGGTLAITTNSAGTGAMLAQAGALTLGKPAIAATETTPEIPGWGDITITTNGSNAVLSGVAAAPTSIRGGDLTINTTGTVNGSVTQGAGQVRIGDSENTGRLAITAGTGAVTLSKLTANRDGRVLDVTVNSAGATTLGTDAQGDLNLRASTITGNLALSTSNGNIRSGGETTVTGGNISLTASGSSQRGITFRGPGDLTFAAVAGANNTAAGVTLVSTTGSVSLPGMTVNGNLTVTAQTNIIQTGAIINTKAGTDDPLTTTVTENLPSRVARFDAVTGSVTLTTATNDFTRLVIRNSPGGANVVDLNSVVLADGNNATGNVFITAPKGIQLGANPGDVLTFNGDLNLTTTDSGVASATVSGGGVYTLAPTFTAGGGVTGTTTLSVAALTAPTTTGSGYTTIPAVVLNGGGSTGATASARMSVNAIAVSNSGTGFTSAPTVTIDPSPDGGPASATVTAITYKLASTVTIANPGTGYVVGDTFAITGAGGAGALLTVSTVGTGGTITGLTVAQGAGYTAIPAVGAATTVAGTGAALSTTAALDTVTASAGSGYTFRPSVTITGGGGTDAAANTRLSVTGLAVTNAGTGYTSMPTISIAANTTTAGVFSNANGATAAVTGTVTGVTVTNPGAALVTASPGALTFVNAPLETAAGGAAGTALLGAGGGVTDASNNVTVLNALNITGPGAVVIDGATSSAIGLNHRFGPINVNQAGSAGGVTVYEMTTLNLGAINSLGNLRAYSSAGDIIDTGPITVNNAIFGAGTAAAPGNITIDAANNAFTGRISLLDDYALATNTAPGNNANGDVVGTYLANNVAIALNSTINLAPVASTAGTGIAGTLTLAANGNINLTGQTNVAGNVTLTGGQIMATNNDNQISNVTVNANNNVDFRGGSTLTVNAALTQATAGRTASFRSSGALRIGTFNSDYTGVDDVAATVAVDETVPSVRFEARGNNTVADTVNGVRVFGSVHFQSQAGITVNRAGHSFGRVSASTSDRDGNIVITESGGLRLGTIRTDGTGSFTATSTTGDILQDVTQGAIRLGNGVTGTATFNSTTGNVTLNDTTGTVNNIPRIHATAGGNIVINNPVMTTLGNITAGGTLTVNATGGADANIDQLANARINSYGTTTFATQSTGSIVIGNTGNRMGGIVATALTPLGAAGTGGITLTESTTLNIRSLQTGGAVAVTSENGNIIQTTDATLANNAIGTAAVAVNGTFSAPKGDITLGLSNNLGTVGFSTGGNVSILDMVGNTTLAASTIGGALDVTNGVGSIAQTGTLKVAGNVSLTALAGGITLSDTANEFGAVLFRTGPLGVLIAENTTFNLRGGGSSMGPVQIVTNGNFVTSGAGATSIISTVPGQGTLTIQAQGTIIPGAGSLIVRDAFTVFSPSLKDLSALSKQGNLFGRDPVNLGTGPYTPPGL